MEQKIIERVIQANDIVEVISTYLVLKKSGKNYKANCPFHQEKTASFVVSQEKQIFKCFGCGKSGNVISFLMEYEKINFMEAIRILAKRSGIKIEAQASDENSKTNLLIEINELSNSFYKKNLAKNLKFPKEYLKKRNLNEKTIKDFELGFALDSFHSLKDYLLKAQKPLDLLVESGLIVEKNANYYDLFRNRLIFPIFSISGKILAFGGRVLDENQKTAKYVNSPTTPIYQKGQHLYGLYQNKHNIATKNKVILVEGYMDLLRLHECGYDNCVASLGTALTEAQIYLILRYTKNFILIYDGDEAGIKASIKSAELIIENEANVEIVFLPNKEDPDSFLQKNKNVAFDKLLDNVVDFISFIKNNTTLYTDEKEKINYLLTIAEKINKLISKYYFIKKISETFKIKLELLESKIKTKLIDKKEIKFIYGDERNLLKILVNNKFILKDLSKFLDDSYFFNEDYKQIFSVLKENLNKDASLSVLIEEFKEDKTKDLFSSLIIEKYVDKSIDTLKIEVEIKNLQKELTKINELFLQFGNPDLLLEKINLIEKISNLRKKIGEKQWIKK